MSPLVVQSKRNQCQVLALQIEQLGRHQVQLDFRLYADQQGVIDSEIQIGLDLGICNALIYLDRNQLLALSEMAIAAADHLSPVS